ncbi:MAG: hypothetical protein KIS67_24225 [Verrucomicrobiae bacterium]|nr:hypothetical protein [Verrucomicrobiae bacterium]
MRISNLFRSRLLIGSLLLQLVTIPCFHAHAAAGDVDLSFDPGSGVNGGVSTIALQPDGKVLISGSFTTVKGLSRPGLARLNADGSGDNSFNPAVAGGGLFALQADGKVLVNTYGGLVRLHADGSLDNTFSASIAAFDEGIYSIAVQPDGKVLIGGGFTVVNGTNRVGIARLNTNGSLDTSFDPGTGAYGVYAIALQPDGRVLIAGGFQAVNGTNRNHVARLHANGSLDGSFDPGAGPSDWVYTMALQPDGKVFIGGNFFWCHGTISHGIARLNDDGTRDSSFNPGTLLTGDALNYSTVISLATQAGGKVLVGGTFALNATNWINLARLNGDGTHDTGFDPGTSAGNSVVAVAVQPDGKMFIGGAFTSVHGTKRHGIARLNIGGSLDASFDPGGSIDSGVLTTALQPDGKLLIGGTFTTVGGLARTGLARLNPDGSVDDAFHPDINFLATASYIRSITLQPDGKVLATGIFAPTNGVPSGSVARFNPDGSWDSGFWPDLWPFVQPGDCLPNYGCWQSVEATSVLVQPDGKVLVGGHAWTTVYGDEWSYDVLRPFLGRFETNGSRDWSFTSGTNYSESCMILQPDGKLVVGGVEGISRLHPDGSLDLAFNAGPIGSVRSIALQPDGKLVLGGAFYVLQAPNHSGVLRLNANGSVDGSFNYGPGMSGAVQSVALQPDGKVLVGGDYYFLSGTNYIYGITRRNADGTLDAGFNQGTSWGGAVRSIAVQSDGNILIGGNFTTVKGVLRPRVARLFGQSVPPSLNLVRSNALVTLSWPVGAPGFQLQESTNPALPGAWLPVAQLPVTNGAQISVTVPASAERKFFRLWKE